MKNATVAVSVATRLKIGRFMAKAAKPGDSSGEADDEESIGRYAGGALKFVKEVLGEKPYNKQEEILRAVGRNRRVSVVGCNGSGKDWSATYREIDITDADGFFRSVFTNVLEVLAPHAAIYCWHAHKRCGVIQRVWEDLGILDHQQVVWVKPTAVFGRVYSSGVCRFMESTG